jgi:hypothetical protein
VNPITVSIGARERHTPSWPSALHKLDVTVFLPAPKYTAYLIVLGRDPAPIAIGARGLRDVEPILARKNGEDASCST